MLVLLYIIYDLNGIQLGWYQEIKDPFISSSLGPFVFAFAWKLWLAQITLFTQLSSSLISRTLSSSFLKWKMFSIEYTLRFSQFMYDLTRSLHSIISLLKSSKKKVQKIWGKRIIVNSWYNGSLVDLFHYFELSFNCYIWSQLYYNGGVRSIMRQFSRYLGVVMLEQEFSTTQMEDFPNVSHIVNDSKYL